VIKQINKFTGPWGYAVGLKNAKRSKDNVNRPFCKAYIKCDRGGTRKKGFNEFERRRETTSRNWNCEWCGILHRTTEFTWVFHIHEPLEGHRKDTHNHEPSSTQASHPRPRREALAPLKYTFVDIPTQQQHAIPGQILNAINEHDYGTPIILKNINNRRGVLAKQQLNGRSPMQALLFELQESNQFRYFYAIDEQNQVTQMFLDI
jgi:hypothetical protein